jgi:hypothetical protein
MNCYFPPENIVYVGVFAAFSSQSYLHKENDDVKGLYPPL